MQKPNQPDKREALPHDPASVCLKVLALAANEQAGQETYLEHLLDRLEQNK